MIIELTTTEMPGTKTSGTKTPSTEMPGTEQQCHMDSVSVNVRLQSRPIIHLGSEEADVEKSWSEAESE